MASNKLHISVSWYSLRRAYLSVSLLQHIETGQGGHTSCYTFHSFYDESIPSSASLDSLKSDTHTALHIREHLRDVTWSSPIALNEVCFFWGGIVRTAEDCMMLNRHRSLIYSSLIWWRKSSWCASWNWSLVAFAGLYPSVLGTVSLQRR